MQFHVFFLSITIQRKHLSEEEISHDQQCKKIMDTIQDRRSSYYNQMY
ncbi:YrzI family small protein [Bacillus gaemokensis]|nr:YrzI family small protein [Bacillus gaemokensis]KYG34720.1 polyketide synthase [Bacillus gaemokensis]